MSDYSYKHDSREDVSVSYDELRHKTEKAVLLIINDQEVWLPLKEVDLDEDHEEVTMPAWLAKKNELT